MLIINVICFILGFTLAAKWKPEIEMWLMALKEAVRWWRWQDA